MSRTEGSGWGGGPMLYQKCPFCGKKKVIYDWINSLAGIPFKCTACKERFSSDTLITSKYPVKEIIK
jgi:transposase-like protein